MHRLEIASQHLFNYIKINFNREPGFMLLSNEPGSFPVKIPSTVLVYNSGDLKWDRYGAAV